MKKVKILNLYGQALGLNGDEKNITAFEQRISEMGYEYEETELGVGDEINTEGYDIVFMTHGKPRNVAQISEHFEKYGEHIKSQIEKGQVFVVTGSSNMLLGNDFKMLDGKTYKGIGLLDCRSEEFDSLYVADAVLVPDFAEDKKMFGCVYRFADVKYNKPNYHKMFSVIREDGEGKNTEAIEGCHINNLYSTWCLGPILARNPVMMREVLKKVLGDGYKETDMSLEEKAVDQIISEYKI